ncbi:DUF4350 domain-containing protein [Roseivirga sp.]|uniref:DUF4350 domain-containing protein n=1 Tax=Roseivirga sp. TaxID=1964215 RepID=UPI003B8BD2A3
MKEKKYVVALVVLVAVYVAVEMLKGSSLDWTPTYHNKHSIPFGTLVTHDLMADMLEESDVESAFKTIYELGNEDEDRNLLLIGEAMALDKNDVSQLLAYVDEGRTVILSGKEFSGALSDTLKFIAVLKDPLMTTDFEAIQESLAGEDREIISVSIGDKISTHSFSGMATTSSFPRYRKENFNVIATNESNEPVLMEYNGLKGRLILSSMPLALTNYFVLNEETTDFASTLLSFFPKDEPVLHVEYYRLGRLESQTPLRVVLSNRSLRWAMFILLFTLLIFIFFESKRRQRIIPLIDPMKNLSVEFVETLGRLYYRQKDHRKLAVKRVAYWKDVIRRKYNLKPSSSNENFMLELSKKTGKAQEDIELLLLSVDQVETGGEISLEQLMSLEKQLNAFYGIE